MKSLTGGSLKEAAAILFRFLGEVFFLPRLKVVRGGEF